MTELDDIAVDRTVESRYHAVIEASEIFRELAIYGLDEYGKKRVKFTYKKAFPTTLKGLNYDYQPSGDMRLVSGFVFIYSQMHIELLNS
jgi:hypothetical protein